MMIASLLHFGRSGSALSWGCQFLIWLGLFGSVPSMLFRLTFSVITCRRVKRSLRLRRCTTGRCTDSVTSWVQWDIGSRSTRSHRLRGRNEVIWKFGTTICIVYYEGIKREVKRRPRYECRSDERLKTKGEGSTLWHVSHTPWVDRGTGSPKNRDEVNKREVCEFDGWVCVLEVICVRSRLIWIFIERPCCLLWIDEAKPKDKTYIWVSVWWKTTN
jgi:hypothetical protein